MESLVRKTLWLSFPFNIVAACMLAFPASWFGQFAGFPAEGHVLYQYLSAWLVAGFGVAYAWVAQARDLSVPFIQFSAIMKIGVFVIAGLLCLLSDVSWRLVLIASADFMFGLIWLCWIFTMKEK
jgi:hypothetical protein